MVSDTTKHTRSDLLPPGDGKIVVGKWYTNLDLDYAAVQVDELIFFNHSLILGEINAVATAT